MRAQESHAASPVVVPGTIQQKTQFSNLRGWLQCAAALLAYVPGFLPCGKRGRRPKGVRSVLKHSSPPSPARPQLPALKASSAPKSPHPLACAWPRSSRRFQGRRHPSRAGAAGMAGAPSWGWSRVGQCVLGEKLGCHVKELQESGSKLHGVREGGKSWMESWRKPFRGGSLNPQTAQKEGWLETQAPSGVNEGAWKHDTSGKRRQVLLHLQIYLQNGCNALVADKGGWSCAIHLLDQIKNILSSLSSMRQTLISGSPSEACWDDQVVEALALWGETEGTTFFSMDKRQLWGTHVVCMRKWSQTSYSGINRRKLK